MMGAFVNLHLQNTKKGWKRIGNPILVLGWVVDFFGGGFIMGMLDDPGEPPKSSEISGDIIVLQGDEGMEENFERVFSRFLRWWLFQFND